MRILSSAVAVILSLVLNGCNSTSSLHIPENYQANLPTKANMDVERIGQYDSYSCATTSLAMVMSYYGNEKKIWKQDVWEASESSIEDVTKRCGSDMNGLEKAAKKYGYENYEFVSGLSLDELKYLVSRDIPVVINIRNFFKASSHAVVVTGYDEEHFYINDPGNNEGGQYTVSYDKLLKHWHASLCSPRKGKFSHSAFILYKNTDSSI